jgi:hypothetical protein
MEYYMNEFFPPQTIKLDLKPFERGVLFIFHRSTGGPGDPVQVQQSWLSVHLILSRLRNSRRYCAKDVPLLIWKEAEELHIKYHSPEDQVVEECVFTRDETEKILMKLERLPSWN